MFASRDGWRPTHWYACASIGAVHSVAWRLLWVTCGPCRCLPVAPCVLPVPGGRRRAILSPPPLSRWLDFLSARSRADATAPGGRSLLVRADPPPPPNPPAARGWGGVWVRPNCEQEMAFIEPLRSLVVQLMPKFMNISSIHAHQSFILFGVLSLECPSCPPTLPISEEKPMAYVHSVVLIQGHTSHVSRVDPSVESASGDTTLVISMHTRSINVVT